MTKQQDILLSPELLSVAPARPDPATLEGIELWADEQAAMRNAGAIEYDSWRANLPDGKGRSNG